MQRLNVDWRSSSASAARRKLPWSAAARAYRRCTRSTVAGGLRKDEFVDLTSVSLCGTRSSSQFKSATQSEVVVAAHSADNRSAPSFRGAVRRPHCCWVLLRRDSDRCPE